MLAPRDRAERTAGGQIGVRQDHGLQAPRPPSTPLTPELICRQRVRAHAVAAASTGIDSGSPPRHGSQSARCTTGWRCGRGSSAAPASCTIRAVRERSRRVVQPARIFTVTGMRTALAMAPIGGGVRGSRIRLQPAFASRSRHRAAVDVDDVRAHA